MERIHVDSWAWLEYFAGTAAGKQVHDLTVDEHVQLITSIINEYEVFAKLLRIKNSAYAIEALDFIEGHAKVEPLSRELVQSAAELKVSNGLGMADSIVAATAEKYGATILTGDPDFKDFNGKVDVKFLK